MRAVDRQQVRLSVLRYAAAAQGNGLSAGLLQSFIAAEGQRITEAELSGELIYLEDKKLLARVSKTLSPEMKLWRITAEGRDFLAENGAGDE